MTNLEQVIVSLAIENCELRQKLKEAREDRDSYRTWWLNESMPKHKEFIEAIEREGQK